MPKREVTAVAVRDGAIYAAAVGLKPTPAVSAPSTPAPAQTAAPPAPGAANATPQQPSTQARPAPAPTPTPTAPVSAVAGGSDVFRIDPDGDPRRVWTSAQDVVYAIAFDASGRPIIGAGNKGSLYRVDSPTVYTELLTEPATQVTSILAGTGGRLYAVTGNPGKIYEIGPGLESEGTFESAAFDAGMYTLWGRVSFEATLNGASVAISTRSGNVESPGRNWSEWSAAVTDPKGARVASPAARFVQWRATLRANAAGASPELDSVDIAYLPKNIEPRVDLIDMTPPNYKFPAPTTYVIGGPRQTMSLPTLTRRPASTAPVTPSESEMTITPSMQYAKGWIGARWLASDPNGDSLLFSVEIRGSAEKQWKPLKDKLAEKYYSWDSTAFPDGEYRLRVTATDSPSNPPGEALTASVESDPFIVDNSAPRITGLAARRVNGKLEVRWHAADALNNIEKAEYSLDGADWAVAVPVTKLSDSPELDYVLTLDAASGEHTIAVRVRDDYENEAVEKAVVRE